MHRDRWLKDKRFDIETLVPPLVPLRRVKPSLDLAGPTGSRSLMVVTIAYVASRRALRSAGEGGASRQKQKKHEQHRRMHPLKLSWCFAVVLALLYLGIPILLSIVPLLASWRGL
jgi:hypothetical protein